MEPQTLPPHQAPETEPKPAAKAMKPANQNSIVRASTPRRANFGAEGMNRGASMTHGKVITRVKTPAKIMKLTSEGEMLFRVLSLNQEATTQE